MVDEGKLLYDGALTQLRASLGGSRRLRLEFGSDPGVITLNGAELVKDEETIQALPHRSRGRLAHFVAIGGPHMMLGSGTC